MKLKILMLVMITLMVFTAYFMYIPVHAIEEEKMKPLIILEGNVDKTFYEVEGYVIIENKVASDVPGEYEILYQSLEEGIKVKRKVVVISNEEKAYFALNSYTINTFKDYPMILEKIEVLNENKQLLIVKYLTDVENNKGHIYMYIIEDNVVTKEVQLYYNAEVEINDLVVDGDVFVFTGKIWNSLYSNYDIILCACRSDGFKLCSKRIGGTATDVAYKLEVTDSSYLLMGLTDSTDGEFLENQKSGRYFIMSVDKNSYEITQVGTEPNEVNFEKLYFLNHLDKLYLVYQTDLETLKLVNIDALGNYLKTKTMNYSEEVELKNVYLYDENIYVLLEGKDIFEIGKITLKDGYIKIKEYPKIGEYVDSQYHDGLLTILYHEADYYDYLVINAELELIYEHRIAGKISEDSNIQILTNKIFESNHNLDKITIHQLSYLKIQSLGETIVDSSKPNYHNYSVIINGKKVTYDKNKSIDEVVTNYFGSYDVQYFIEDDFILIMSKEVRVLADCGVEDKGIYDLGVKIYLNSLGYLNNELINSGYQIEEEGVYQLKLVGYRGETQIINFEVRNLSIDKYIPEEPTFSYDIEIETMSENSQLMNCEIIPTITDNHIGNVKTWQWVYTIPALLAIGVGFIVVKLKY